MTFLVDFCIFAAGWAIGVFAHEGGHWLVGSLLRIPIYLVRVGIGPVWYRGRVGTIDVELHALPAKGIVFYHPPLRTGGSPLRCSFRVVCSPIARSSP